MKYRSLILPVAAIQLACILWQCPVSSQTPPPGAQTPRSPQLNSQQGAGDIVVRLRDQKGGEIKARVKITLQNNDGTPRSTAITEKGHAAFRGVPLGRYEVQVDGQGYSKSTTDVSLLREGETLTLGVVLRLTDGSEGATDQPTIPTLSMKEQKELTAGLRALQAQRLPEARKHFLSAAKTNPNHPDVDYLLGVLAAMRGDITVATQYFENGSKLYPHVASLTALGEIHLMEGNLSEAQLNLENALRAQPNSWRAEQLLATVTLKQGAYAEAVEYAEDALQHGKSDAKGARLTLAEALAASGDRKKSDQVLNELLNQSPTVEQAAEARRLLDLNRRSTNSETTLARSADTTDSSAPINPNSRNAGLLSSAWVPSAPANPLAQFPRWTPPNIDDAIPPVDREISCPMPQILAESGKRVLEFVENVNRYTATETFQHESVNEFGLAIRSERLRFSYVVSIQEFRPGVFDVQEFRDNTTSAEMLPENVDTRGTVALLFVFHPNYAEDYDFQCEGQTHEAGQTVWQVHFAQKPGSAPRLHSYRLANLYFRVGIKGRAWISSDTFQVLRMESDVVKRVPEIRLRAEHQEIRYGPVQFEKRQLVLWLPTSSETYLDFNGHRFHRRQEFSKFLLFWVDDKEIIRAPRETTQKSKPTGLGGTAENPN